MAKVLVYDAYANKFYKYNLSENDPMPYSYGNTMRLREFRGSSGSQTLWTTVAAMEAWNLTRRRYGKGIYIGYAFKRIWEGGHGTTSQHYAGVSFDVGQNVSSAERVRIQMCIRDSPGARPRPRTCRVTTRPQISTLPAFRRWARAGLRSMKFQILQSRAMRAATTFCIGTASTIWALARTPTAALAAGGFSARRAQRSSFPGPRPISRTAPACGKIISCCS